MTSQFERGEAGESASESGDSGEAEASASGYRALTGGCAIAPAPAVSRLVLSGEDRLRFLHGQTTCEVTSLEEGDGAYGFILDPKGHILSDAVICSAADRLVLDLPPESRAMPEMPEAIAERLRLYVVADRVEIAADAVGPGLLVAGPGAAAALSKALDLASGPPAGWGCLELDRDGGRIFMRGDLRVGLPAWRIDGSADAVAELGDVLGGLECSRATAEDVETVRLERGIPLCGVDFGAGHFPQETGLEEWAVSYTKGCYLGQEVVARIHYRGKVNHMLRGLAGSGSAAPEAGSILVDAEGAEAGRLSSSAFSPAISRPIGLAILHRRGSDPGTKLYADGAELEVVEVPFI